jgi:hypothetical protein
MPWITDDTSKNEIYKYWLPDTLPEPTLEYTQQQGIKKYLTPDNQERSHPGWYFDNKALVSDDYLFFNEGWRRLIDESPTETKEYKVVLEDISTWNIDPNDQSIAKKYSLVERTAEEIFEYEENILYTIRYYRNNFLQATDFYVVKSIEKNLSLSEEFKNYRDQLRDIPQTVDIATFNVDTFIWPTIPENIYI